jgi:iron complex outermembrane recepter protein
MNVARKTRLEKCAAAVALTIAVYPAMHRPAHADEIQKGEIQKGEIQKVEVTGSHIKRTDTETASPVQVLTRREIEQMGANTVQEILSNLTSNSNDAISDLGGANSWASGSTGVSLRNLGVNATLVLLNGRRVSAFGFADGLQSNFVNIDAIPSDVIERVEILKDGASAIYGSDAIAGVINIITRRDFEGVGVKAVAQQSLRAHILDAEKKASITGGLGNLDRDGYNAFAHLEIFHRDNYTDRAIRPYLPDWFIEVNPDRDSRSTGSIPGNYVGRYPSNYSDPALAGKRISQAVPGCAPENLQGGLCWFDYWANSDARPPADRVTFLASGRLKLSEGRQAYGEVQLASLRNEYHTAIPRSNVTGVPQSWYNWNKGSLQYFTDPQLPVGHPSNPFDFPIGLNYRFADYPDMFKNVGASTQYRVLGGMEGSDFGWDWDSAIGVMGSHATQKQHLYRDRYAYYDAIVSGEYKFGQQNSRELLDRMFPEMGSHGTYRQSFFDLKASRDIGKLDGGPLQIAAGVDLRHESFEHASSDNIQDARIVGFSAVSISGARNLAAGYVELNAPFTSKLEGNFALRGDRAIGQAGAVVPKAGLKYKLTDSFMLRGTLAQGFRAPSLPETGNGGASWFNNQQVDPKRCDTAIKMRDILSKGNTEDKFDAVTAYNAGCSVSFPSAITPNPDLKPERTDSFTLGFVMQPIKEVEVTLDYYSIKRRDEITTCSITETLANEDQAGGVVERDPINAEDIRLSQRVKELSGQDIGFATGPIRTIGLQYQNLSKTRVSGIDLDVKTKWNLGSWGKLNVDLDLGYQRNYQSWDTFKNEYTENWIGRSGRPRTKAILKTSLERGAWVSGARVNYTSGTTLAWGDDDTVGSIEGCIARGIDEGRCRIASDTTVDLWLQYKGWKGTTLQANLFNAFDRRDPEVLVPGQSLPLRGRILMLSLEHKF